MVRVIMGVKGTGKTKQMIDLINAAVNVENGHVLCLAKDNKLMYDIKSDIRLVAANEYTINGYDGLMGFVSGLYASNYDITHIFIDSLTKVVDCDVDVNAENFLDWLDKFSDKNGIKFTVTISADAEAASEGIKKYF